MEKVFSSKASRVEEKGHGHINHFKMNRFHKLFIFNMRALASLLRPPSLYDFTLVCNRLHHLNGAWPLNTFSVYDGEKRMKECLNGLNDTLLRGASYDFIFRIDEVGSGKGTGAQ